MPTGPVELNTATFDAWIATSDTYVSEIEGQRFISLDAGVYTVTETLNVPSNTTIKGKGKQVTKLVVSPDQDITVFNCTGENITIESLSIQRTKSYVDPPTPFNIDNRNPGDDPIPMIDLVDTSHSLIRDVYVWNASDALDDPRGISGIRIKGSQSRYNVLSHTQARWCQIGVEISEEATSNLVLGGAIIHCMVGLKVTNASSNLIHGLGIEDGFSYNSETDVYDQDLINSLIANWRTETGEQIADDLPILDPRNWTTH